MVKDLTVGKTWRVLLSFSIPMLCSVVFQQIYNIADSIIAGKFVGENALAAVGASYPVTMIFLAVAMGCNIGCSVVISQLFGGKNFKDMKTAINTAYIFSLSLGAVLTVFGLIFCNGIISLVNTPANIFDDSSLYLRIYIAGMLFLFLYNICTGIFTALGDSKTPLYFLLASSALNIVLNLIFVIVFKMGVSGVAWATFISQGIASICSFIVLNSRIKKLKCSEKPHVFSLLIFKRILIISIPSILQQSFISVGNMFVQGIINGYGSAVIAGYSAAIKLNTFAIASINTMANGLSSFVAQNIGAGKIKRVHSGFWSDVVTIGIITVPFFICLYFFGDFFLSWFMDTNVSGEAISTGINFLKIVSPFYIIVAFKLIADAVLRGAGAMKTFMTATFLDLILRVVLAFVLSPYMGVTGIWVSWPIGWIVGAVCSLIFYFSGIWKPKKSLGRK